MSVLKLSVISFMRIANVIAKNEAMSLQLLVNLLRLSLWLSMGSGLWFGVGSGVG